MSRELLVKLDALGATATVENGRLFLDESQPLPPYVVAEVRAQKASLLSLLQPIKEPHHGAHITVAELRDIFTERAGICEFDGQLKREDAEARAWREVAAIWYRQHGKKLPKV